ncbi:MAG: hypothetical protein J6X88_05075 [Bacteroidales bacterium]|nr:hypothetical protein [Bacteroidales bacterium]
MKITKTLFVLAAIILFGMGMTTSCKNKTAADMQGEEINAAAKADKGPCLVAIENFLVDSIGKSYSPGEVCIPAYSIIAIDTNLPTVKIWGDWWVFNYNIVGDTLKCVSGGSHPGMFQLEKTSDNFDIVAFDQVEDGSNWLQCAQRIFGEYYDAFHAVNSNQELRDSVRLAMTAQYVKEYSLPVTMLQDHGWPAVALPTAE